MPQASDWNMKTIEEFRANEGRVGGPFQGAPMVLVTHRGRHSGHQHVTPMMYLPDETNNAIIYVFATKGGAPSNPDWYYNLTTAGEGAIERGTDSYPVTVRKLTGDERDRIYAEQARRYPGFADYQKQTAGIRTIPVLELTRTQPRASRKTRAEGVSRHGSLDLQADVPTLRATFNELMTRVPAPDDVRQRHRPSAGSTRSKVGAVVA